MPKSDLLNEELAENEKLFVEQYFSQSSDTFGNGTQSVINAFGEAMFKTDTGSINYNFAGVKSYELLRTPKIYMAGKELLNKQGFNDNSVEAQHSFLINQSADMGVKARAIDMYYKLVGRYIEKHETKVEVVDKLPEGLTKDELLKIANIKP